MIRDPEFWESDVQSAATRLFERNQGFLTQENSIEKIGEARKWLEALRRRCEVDVEENMISMVEDEAMQHLFEMDAVRTFGSEVSREKHKRTLSTIYQFTQDYHQGLGFVVAWLLLFFQPQEVVGIARVLHEGPMIGYFRKEAATLFRDAKVVEQLMEKRFPKAYKQLDESGISAGTYSSKWLVALNLHCLPFEHLFKFYTDLFNAESMTRYLFGYSMAAIEAHESHITATPQVDKILEHLRNDLKVHPDKENMEFFAKMVDRARYWAEDVTDDEIKEARAKAQVGLDEQAARRQSALEADESSDGISFSDEESEE